MFSNLRTIVATPRKCPGRKAPSRIRERLDLHECAKTGWIKAFHLGSEHQVDAGLPAKGQVFFQRPRVTREVLVRSELRRVDEDGHDDETALAPGRLDQAGMPRVKGPHRRYAANREAPLAGTVHGRANVCGLFRNDHFLPTLMFDRPTIG